jgi:hypothetical protein
MGDPCFFMTASPIFALGSSMSLPWVADASRGPSRDLPSGSRPRARDRPPTGRPSMRPASLIPPGASRLSRAVGVLQPSPGPRARSHRVLWSLRSSAVCRVASRPPGYIRPLRAVSASVVITATNIQDARTSGILIWTPEWRRSFLVEPQDERGGLGWRRQKAPARRGWSIRPFNGCLRARKTPVRA